MAEKKQSERCLRAPGARPQCPLCSRIMQQRRRDPLVRAAGMMLIYLSLFLILLWLPDVTRDEFLATAICLVTGAVALRQRTRLWCPRCWYLDGDRRGCRQRRAPRHPGGSR